MSDFTDGENPEVSFRLQEEQLVLGYKERLADPESPELKGIAIDFEKTRFPEDALTVVEHDDEHTIVGVSVVDSTVIPPAGPMIDKFLEEAMRSPDYSSTVKPSFDVRSQYLSFSSASYTPAITGYMYFRHCRDEDGRLVVSETELLGFETTNLKLTNSQVSFDTVLEDLYDDSQLNGVKRDIKILDEIMGYLSEGDDTKMSAEDLVGFYNVYISRWLKGVFDAYEATHCLRYSLWDSEHHAPFTSPVRDYSAFINLHNLRALLDEAIPPFNAENISPVIDSDIIVQP